MLTTGFGLALPRLADPGLGSPRLELSLGFTASFEDGSSGFFGVSLVVSALVNFHTVIKLFDTPTVVLHT